MRRLTLFVFAIAASIGILQQASGALVVTVGDNDGYGLGHADNSSFSFPNPANPPPGSDHRGAAELAATNGARETDIFSSIFSSGSTSVNVMFPLPVDITSGILEIDMYGFNASSQGQITVSFNGVSSPNFLDFDDGPQQSVVRQFVLDQSVIDNANAADELIMALDRASSGDAIAFDYFELRGELGAVIPEPSTFVVWSMLGVVVLALGMRRCA